MEHSIKNRNDPVETALKLLDMLIWDSVAPFRASIIEKYLCCYNEHYIHLRLLKCDELMRFIEISLSCLEMCSSAHTVHFKVKHSTQFNMHLLQCVYLLRLM